MSEEQTAVAEEATEVEATEVEETTGESTSESTGVDYKAEHDRLIAERDKYKRESEQKGRDLRDIRREKREERETQTTESSESTGPDVDAAIQKGLDKIERRRIQDEIEDTLYNLIKNSDERELVRVIYEDQLRPSGFTRSAIRKDIRRARILANSSKIEAEVERKVRKDVAQEKAMRNSSSNTRGKVSEEGASAPNMSSAEKKWSEKFRRQNNLQSKK